MSISNATARELDIDPGMSLNLSAYKRLENLRTNASKNKKGEISVRIQLGGYRNDDDLRPGFFTVDVSFKGVGYDFRLDNTAGATLNATQYARLRKAMGLD